MSKPSSNLQPLYDAISSRNWKSALRLCEKRDVAGLSHVRALKAHVLERTGQVDEALQLARDVLAGRPTDEGTLATLTSVLKYCGAEGEALAAYKTALAAKPDSNVLARGLAICYARRGELKALQKHNMAQFARSGRAEQMAWAALAMVLQVEQAGGSAMLYTLAERCLTKLPARALQRDGGMRDLLIRILRAQGKHGEALTVLTDSHRISHAPLPTRLARDDTARGQEDVEASLLEEGELRVCVGEFAEAFHAFRRVLTEVNADSWDALQGLVNALQPAWLAADSHPAVLKVRALLDDLVARFPRFRGPRLAQLSLAAARVRVSSPAEARHLLAAQLSAIAAYLTDFGHLYCAFADLQPYMTPFLPPWARQEDSSAASSALAADYDVSADGDRTAVCRPNWASAKQRSQLVQQLHQLAEENDPAAIVASTPAEVEGASEGEGAGEGAGEGEGKTEEEEKKEDSKTEEEKPPTAPDGALLTAAELRRRKDSLRRFIAAHQLLRFVGQHDSAVMDDDAAAGCLRQLYTAYQDTLYLNAAAPGGQRENQVGDDLVLLCALLLQDLWAADGCRARALEAALLLEDGLRRSTHNFRIRLQLLRLYNALNDGEAAVLLYNDLKVRQIQRDSMTYLIVYDMLELGLLEEAKRACSDVTQLHRMSKMETPDYIATAYRNNNYDVVADMLDFMRRMETSRTLTVCSTLGISLQLGDAVRSSNEAHAFLRSLVLGSRDAPGLSSTAEQLASLSENEDYEFTRLWDTPPVDAAKVAALRRPQALKWVAVWQAIPKALFWLLEGNATAASERLRVLEAALQKLQLYDPRCDAEAEAERLPLSELSPLQAQWTFGLSLMRAAAALVSADGATSPASTAALQRSEAVLQATAAALSAMPLAEGAAAASGEEEEKKEGDAADKDSGPLCRTACKTLSQFVWSSATWLVLFVSVWTKLLPKEKKAKKAKKGRKGKKAKKAASKSAAPAAVSPRAALRSMVESAITLLAAINDRLKAASRAGGRVHGDAALSSDALLLPYWADAERAELRRELTNKLREGHRTSIVRLQGLVAERLSQLRSVRV